MIIVLMFVLKSAVVFAAVWWLCRCPWFSAAQRHLVLVFAIMSLPLLVLIEIMPSSVFTFAPPASVSAWEVAFQAPIIDLESQQSIKPRPLLFNPYGIVTAVYLLGAVSLCLLWLVRILNTERWIGLVRPLPGVEMKKLGRAIPLWESANLQSPITWGVLEPRIVVPEDWCNWSEDKKRAALIHELAHIDRYDTLTTILTGLVCSLFWLHPMVWITQSKIRIEAERACDDAVIAAGASNIEYAGLLLEIARERRVGMALAMASPQMLSTRIHAILDNTLRRSPMTMKQLSLSLILAMTIVVPLGSLKAANPGELFPLGSDSDLMPIVKVGAVYPEDARKRSIEGFVVVQFTVSEAGTATDAVVVDAQPVGVFEEAALKAVARFKYKPRVVDGAPIAVQGIRNRITFRVPPKNSGSGSAESTSIKNVTALSDDVYSRIAAMQALIDDKDFAAARVKLSELKLDAKSMTANELARVYNVAGFLAYSAGDILEAISEFGQVLAQGDEVSHGLRASTLFTLAQLAFTNEEFETALKHIRQWKVETGHSGPTPLIFMAQTYHQLSDYPSAIEYLEAGLEVARTSNLEIKENWLALLAYLYYEEERWNEVVSVLDILNQDFPDEKYATRLKGVQEIVSEQESTAS